MHMYLGGLGDYAADVTSIFQQYFGRTPAAGGLNFWVTALNNGSVTESNLAASILAAASASDLAYYNAHHGATGTTTAAAPASSNLVTAANIAAEAQSSPNAIIMTPGVSSYADHLRNVNIAVGESGGTISAAQTWIALTGYSDQWWQEVQAAYSAGKSPTKTTFRDTWAAMIPPITSTVPMGSAAAIANLKPALPDYITFLHNAGATDEIIALRLAGFGVTPTGAPLTKSGSSTPASSGFITLPSSAPAGAPVASPPNMVIPVEPPASLPTSSSAMQIVSPPVQATPTPSSPTVTVGTGTLTPSAGTATGNGSGAGGTTTQPAWPVGGNSQQIETLATDSSQPSTEAQVVSTGTVSPMLVLAGLALAFTLMNK